MVVHKIRLVLRSMQLELQIYPSLQAVQCSIHKLKFDRSLLRISSSRTDGRRLTLRELRARAVRGQDAVCSVLSEW